MSEPCTLAQLPCAWLHSLLHGLDSRTRLALFQTCTTLRDCVLEHCQPCTFRLQDSLNSSVSRLRLACAHSTCIRLVLDAASFQGLSKVVMDTPNKLQFANIRQVSLQGVVLDSLVPAWLTCMFPDLATLKLDRCSFSSHPTDDLHARTLTTPYPNAYPNKTVSTSSATDVIQQPNHLPTSSSLAHLHVHLPSNVPDAQQARWHRQQLQALPQLTALAVHAAAQEWLELFEVVGRQVTRLRTGCWGVCGTNYRPLRDLQHWFPSLVWLDIRDTCRDLKDDDMKVLVSMPCLRHVRCTALYLDHDHNYYDDVPHNQQHPYQNQHQHQHQQQQQQWPRSLGCYIDSLGVERLDMQSCARMRIGREGHVRSIVMTPPECEGAPVVIYANCEPNATDKVVEAITLSGGLRWEGVVTHVNVLDRTALAGSERLRLQPHHHQAAQAGMDGAASSAHQSQWEHDAECSLSASLKLLSSCPAHTLTLTRLSSVTPVLLNAIAKHLGDCATVDTTAAATMCRPEPMAPLFWQSLHGFTTVAFAHSTFMHEAIPLILPSLPLQVRTLCLDQCAWAQPGPPPPLGPAPPRAPDPARSEADSGGLLTESQLVSVCKHAVRRIRVLARRHARTRRAGAGAGHSAVLRNNGWEERVHARVIETAGHMHVTLAELK